MSAAELAVHERPTMSTQGIDCHGPHSTILFFSRGIGRLRFSPVNHENTQRSSFPLCPPLSVMAWTGLGKATDQVERK